MLKQLMSGLLLIAAPMTLELYADQCAVEGVNSLSEPSLTLRDGPSSIKGQEARRRCDDRRKCRDKCNDRCEKAPECFTPDVAFFYLTESDVNTDGPITIGVGDSIFWLINRFTIKSSDISIGGPGFVGTSSPNIVFVNSGIFLITYTVYAGSLTPAVFPPDSYTMQLQINGSAVAGSTFTATFPITLITPPALDNQELVGQVITYVPAGAALELVNVSSRAIVSGVNGNNGNFASISIEKVADFIQ